VTAPDPRLDEIQARRSSEPCDRHDWCAISDIAYLLTELRKAHEALAAIHTVPPISHGIDDDARFANGYNEALRRVRAAVAAAKGDERG
jgi:hypothetical protein